MATDDDSAPAALAVPLAVPVRLTVALADALAVPHDDAGAHIHRRPDDGPHGPLHRPARTASRPAADDLLGGPRAHARPAGAAGRRSLADADGLGVPDRHAGPVPSGSPSSSAGGAVAGSGGGSGSGHSASRRADVVLGVPLPALQQTARRLGDAALHIAQEPQYPLSVAALVGIFLLVQDLVDRRDPKLAQARVSSRDERLLFPDIFPPGGSS